MAEVARREFLSRRNALSENICGMAERIVGVFRLAMEGFGRFRAESLRPGHRGRAGG